MPLTRLLLAVMVVAGLGTAAPGDELQAAVRAVPRGEAPERTNRLRFLSFYGNGNAEEITVADRGTLVDVHANVIATNNLTVCEQAWRADKLQCMLT
jgi:hypothetical protein